MALKKINYHGSSKVIIRLCEMVNQLIDGGGGGGGSTVSYTQTLQSGTKTGSISIDGVSTDMYAPTPPTKLSELSNDAGFIDNTVNNLVNYYKKAETYTQAEVQALIGQIATLTYLVVQTLPTQDISTSTIYLVPKTTAGTNDVYDEYLYINNAWEHIGSTQVDLSQYYTKTETDTLLNGKVDTESGKGLSSNDYTTTEKNKLSGIASGAEVNVQANWNETDNTSDAYIQNKPTIPSATSDLTNDSNFVSDANYTHTDNNYTTTEKNKLSGIEAGAQANVQADWNQTDNTADDYIKNKPTIPSDADDIDYDNTTSGLTATNVQDAIDEVANSSGSYSEGDGINITNDTISVDTTFTEAQTRTNIASGDLFATILGKIKKFFTDLGDLAFLNKDGTTSTKFLRGDGTWQNAPSGTQSDWDETDTSSMAYIQNKPNMSDYVAKSGDTMTGALNINHSGSDTPLALKGNSTDSTYINFKNSEGANLGYLYIDGNNAGLYKGGKKPFALQSQLGDYVAKSGDTMTGTLNTATENNVCLNLRPSNAELIDTVSVQTGGNEAVVFANKNESTSWMFVNGEDSVTNHSSTRWQSLVPALQMKKGCVSIGKLIGNNENPHSPLQVNGRIFQCGVNEISGRGSYNYFKIATLTITSGYVNAPITFVVSQRGHFNTTLEIMFKSSSSTDPDLNYFICDNPYGEYYYKKVSTSTWEIYGHYNEVWGYAQLIGVWGIKVNNGINVDINMSNASPSGAIPASPKIQAGEATLSLGADNTMRLTTVSALGGATGKYIVATISSISGVSQPVVLYTALTAGNTGFYIYAKVYSGNLSGATIKVHYMIVKV